MNFELVHSLIFYIIDQLSDQEGYISKIRIVKLLYLIDLEYYRSYERTLTGLEWIYYRYGPYAYDIDSVLRRSRLDLGEESFETGEGHRGFTYHVGTPYSIEKHVNFAWRAKINNIIAHWALEDTRFILDYVYNETEPMRNAVYNQPLDFTTVRRNITVTHRPPRIEVNRKKAAEIRQALKDKIQQSKKSEITPPRYDRLYFDSMATLDGEGTKEFNLQGKITISPEAIDALRERNE